MPDEHRDDGYDPDRWDAKFIEMQMDNWRNMLLTQSDNR